MRYLVGFALLLVTAASLADSLQLRITDHNGNALQHAAVVLGRPDMPKAQPGNYIINQIDEEFVPRVSVIAAGSQVSFPNQDQILHHVYSFSDAKTFEVPLYAGTPMSPVVFESPGMVTLGCNIHDWMQAFVLVTESPWSGTSDEAGNLTIDALEPGSYSLELWHPDQRRAMPPSRVQVQGDSSLELSLETRPAFNLRNAPGGGGGYF